MFQFYFFPPQGRPRVYLGEHGDHGIFGWPKLPIFHLIPFDMHQQTFKHVVNTCTIRVEKLIIKSEAE